MLAKILRQIGAGQLAFLGSSWRRSSLCILGAEATCEMKGSKPSRFRISPSL